MASESTRALAATAARATARALVGLAGAAALGVALNAALLTALVPTMRAMGERIGGVHFAGGSWLVVPYLALAYWPITLTALAFGVAFPAAFFVLAKKHAVHAALAEVARAHGGALVGFVAERFASSARGLLGGQGRAAAKRLVAGYFATLDGVPAVLRPLVRALDARADVRGLLAVALDDAPEEAPFEGDAFTSAARALGDRVARERAVAPSRAWLAWLVAIDAAVALAVRFFAG